MGRGTKRTVIENVDTEEFLQKYFARRNCKGEDECDAARVCMKRAMEAWESFKRTRISEEEAIASREHHNGSGTGALIAAEKYDRRLRSNSKSAAASRAYTGVLLFEKASMLNAIETECQYLVNENASYKRRDVEVSQEIQKLSATCAQFAGDLAALKGKMLEDPFSPDLTVSCAGTGQGDFP